MSDSKSNPSLYAPCASACNQTRTREPFLAVRNSIVGFPTQHHGYHAEDPMVNSPQMQFPNLVPVLVVLKCGPNVLASAAHEKDGLQGVSPGNHHVNLWISLPFLSRRFAVATERKQRPSLCTSYIPQRRAGAVQINLSANAADHSILTIMTCRPPLASLKTRRWTRPSPSARL